ncbi:MAG: hypothetical protein ISS91_01840 [Candidatus Omnitrophica bacterium]|nr:hypothetical protein [Candidatus Omnitrophota bacterium]
MSKETRKILVVLLIAVFAIGSTGCASLKKKFIRKKTEEKKPRYYQVRKYDIKPSMELYEKHYIYWINWHRDMSQKLGENAKRDRLNIQQLVGNLCDMRKILDDEEAARLDPHIKNLRGVEKTVNTQHLDTGDAARVQNILDRELRIVKREFSPSKMKGHIRDDWEKVSLTAEEAKND